MESKIRSAIALISETPDQIQELTQTLTYQHQIWRPKIGHFSILENICHLRDIEAEGYAIRVARILNEEMPLLPDINGTKLAQERNYQADDLTEALVAFRQARNQSLNHLQNLTDELLVREGQLEDVGIINLADLILKMASHDQEHLSEIRELCQSYQPDQA